MSTRSNIDLDIVRVRAAGEGFAEALVGVVPVAMAERYAAAQVAGDRVAGDSAAEEIDTWRDSAEHAAGTSA